MGLRKDLNRSICTLKEDIEHKQQAVAAHKNYFERLIHENGYLVLAALIPFFLAGLREGKKVKRGKTGLFRFGKFLLSSTFAILKNQNLFKP